jgi:hypothetical protein
MTNRLNALDLEALELYMTLKNGFDDLAKVSGQYGNLVGVFFHDLMIHFSGILLLREWKTDYGSDYQFPFVNLAYAIKPVSIDADCLQSKRAERLVKRLAKRYGLLDIAYGQAIVWAGPGARIVGPAFNLLARSAEETRLYLPHRTTQVEFLRSLILELCKKFDITNSDTLLKNWERHLDYHVTDSQKKLSPRKLIIGTRGILQNRILAANFLQQEKEVVAFTHGEISNAVFDEPFFGYSEKTLCSTLVDYGSYIEGGRWNRPLISPVKTIHRSSTFGENHYREETEIVSKELSQARILYIPTLFSRNYVYGPFRSYSDGVYQNWQEELLQKLPSARVKAHPKSRLSVGTKWPVQIETRQLEKCFKEYDILVLDYFSTAMTMAMHSDKPIMYFDIGLRNMTGQFIGTVKERCSYMVIDLAENLSDQIDDALREYSVPNRVWSNTGLRKYSLNHQVAPGDRYHLKQIFS